MPERKFKFATPDFFHIAALKAILDLDWNDVTILGEGKRAKGLAHYETDFRVPSLSDFKVVLETEGDRKEIDLQRFSTIFKDVKHPIFEVIDAEEQQQEEQSDDTAEETAAGHDEGGD